MRNLKISLGLAIVLTASVAVWATTRNDGPPPETITWRYRVIAADDIAKWTPSAGVSRRGDVEATATNNLDGLGAEGWELVTVHNNRFFFKRPAGTLGE